MLTAASAPTLDSFMQCLLQITGRIHRRRSRLRLQSTLVRRFAVRRAPLPGGDPRAIATVRVTAPEPCIRAAHRWPPKRCRILADGDLNAIPVGRTLRRVVSEPSPTADKGTRAPVSPRSNPDRGPGPPNPARLDPPACNTWAEQPVSPISTARIT